MVVRKITLLPALMGIFTILFAAKVCAEIKNSEHDFSSEKWNSSKEMCIVCHTPHNADISDEIVLWNHESTTASFENYASFSLDAEISAPSGDSMACLSCHDGTVAIDSFGMNEGIIIMTGDNLIGTGLKDDHPISFRYTSALAVIDGELYDPATKLSGLPGNGTIQKDMLKGSNGDMVECSSCHDVHNTRAVPDEHLLVKSNENSALCLTCHDK